MSKFSILSEIINRYLSEKEQQKCFANQEIIVGNNFSIDETSSVGSYTYIGSNATIEETTIGRYCSIGDNCTIGPGEHRINNVTTSYRIYKHKIGSEYYNGDENLGRISVGNDVWIGCNVTIRRGVKIGNGAVIGANSFVNKDVPDFAIVGGNPASIIKYRFDKDTIKMIIESAWWEYDIVEARRIVFGIEELVK